MQKGVIYMGHFKVFSYVHRGHLENLCCENMK